MANSDLPLTDDRWAAVVLRDARYDGVFVYAVETTGIYCRPSCGARTPKRAHVAIYPTPTEARAAGFRACKRCQPDAEQTPTEAGVARVRAFIDECLDADPETRLTLKTLAGNVGWSSSYLQRAFTRVVGVSPKAYVDAYRAGRAKRALQEGETVLGATYEGGFGSGKALYDRAESMLGMTPGTYRKGGAGLMVRYALFDTALGVVLVAATSRGVCAISLGDEAAALVDELHADLYAAEIKRDDEALRSWAEPVLRALAGAPGDARAAAEALKKLPVDVRGTALQRQVWAALRQIPVGETWSYGEVAASIGRPRAARAVAQACGANRVALAVPCHRVIGADGALRGYRWGIDRKRALLDAER